MSLESLPPPPNGHNPFPPKNIGLEQRHCFTSAEIEIGRKLGNLKVKEFWLLERLDKLVRDFEAYEKELLLTLLRSGRSGEKPSCPPRGQELFRRGEVVLKRLTSQDTQEKTENTPLRESSLRARARKGRVLEDPGPPEFQAFYAAYPRHVARQPALAAWRAIAPSSDLQARIMTAVKLQTEVNFAGPDAPAIPYPASWLNAGRWTDEIKPPKPRPKTNADRAREWMASVQERIHRHESPNPHDDNPDHWAARNLLPGPSPDR